jgi:hypothetical protein
MIDIIEQALQLLHKASPSMALKKIKIKHKTSKAKQYYMMPYFNFPRQEIVEKLREQINGEVFCISLHEVMELVDWIQNEEHRRAHSTQEDAAGHLRVPHPQELQMPEETVDNKGKFPQHVDSLMVLGALLRDQQTNQILESAINDLRLYMRTTGMRAFCMINVALLNWEIAKTASGRSVFNWVIRVHVLYRAGQNLCFLFCIKQYM